MLALRRLILDTAKATKGVGLVEETLKWGQPSYLTPETKSGSTIRIDQVKAEPGQYAVYFHCQTNLVETFRELYPELRYGGNRSIFLDAEERSRSRVASLRGAGADLSSAASGSRRRRNRLAVIASHRVARTRSPDDRLREAIQQAAKKVWIASALSGCAMGGQVVALLFAMTMGSTAALTTFPISNFKQHYYFRRASAISRHVCPSYAGNCTP